MKPNMKLTYAEFFAGCGGLSLGFIKAGLKCVSALEYAPDAMHTFWANLCYHGWSHLWVDKTNESLIKKISKWDPQTRNWLFKNGIPDNWLKVDEPMPCLNLFGYDITKLEPEQWMEICGVEPGDIQIFAGGPPCQGFSTANSNRSEFDKRNQLPLRLIHYAKVCKPRFVLIENVPGLLTLGKKKGDKEGPFPRYLREAFEEAGYYMYYQVHNAADYGVPQNRKRVLFFAERIDTYMIPFSQFTPTHNIEGTDGLLKSVDVREAIGDLPPLQAGQEYKGEAYEIKRLEGYVICPNCLRYNHKVRDNCHNCEAPLNNPITGNVIKIPGMIMINTEKSLEEVTI